MTNPALSCQNAPDDRQTEPRRTCGGCNNLKRQDIDGMGFIFGCEKTECVVPHHLHRDNPAKSWEVIFWRVPQECPLPDTKVLKSATRAPQRYWVKERIELKNIED